VVGEAERLVLTEMLPETPPEDVGAKTASKVMLLLEASVCAVKFVTLNAAPLTLSDETTKFAVPVFLSVIACVARVPDATLPKLTLEGVMEMPAWVPVPLSAIVRVGFEALLATTRLAVTAAVDAGANWT